MTDEIQPGPGEDKSKHDQPDAPQQPMPVIAPSAGAVQALQAKGAEASDYRTAEQDERKRQRTLEKIAKVQAWCSIALVLFTFGQAWVGGCQWIATRDQYNAMIEQNKLARGQLEQARKATVQTESVITRMELDLRPWISVPVPTVGDLVANTEIIAAFEAKNVGKTPAFIIDHLVDSVILPAQPIGSHVITDLEEIPDGPPLHRAAMAPGMSTDFDGDLPIMSEQEVAEVKAGKKSLFVYARFIYLDASGGQHKTLGCHIYSTVTKDFRAYEKYNDMD